MENGAFDGDSDFIDDVPHDNVTKPSLQRGNNSFDIESNTSESMGKINEKYYKCSERPQDSVSEKENDDLNTMSCDDELETQLCKIVVEVNEHALVQPKSDNETLQDTKNPEPSTSNSDWNNLQTSDSMEKNDENYYKCSEMKQDSVTEIENDDLNTMSCDDELEIQLCISATEINENALVQPMADHENLRDTPNPDKNNLQTSNTSSVLDKPDDNCNSCGEIPLSSGNASVHTFVNRITRKHIIGIATMAFLSVLTILVIAVVVLSKKDEPEYPEQDFDYYG